ncbi:uncharacterized protein KIAA2012 homolog isoform X2 [Syngnathoides biaculeatus]|uniref:uncharacterized protein KIAA2012 homolog isoform X2 n=1 Tax=Syngnathoides biaculeatus TaxID=300417 RepID=UPI002ADD65FB|nr:uncharacterized protein KIAA2012 homolog isoform X2 [Syngnathoides biaculeatus]
MRGGTLQDDLNDAAHKQLKDGLEKEEVATEQEPCNGFDLKSPRSITNKTKADTSVEDTEWLPTDDKHSTDSSVQSTRFRRSPLVSLGTNERSSPRSSCEGLSVRSSFEGLSADIRVLTSSQGQLSSSCSTVMVTEEQLILKLVKTKVSRTNEEENPHLAKRANMWRQELERKEQEEERVQVQEERKQTKENMRNEVDEERRRRVEHLRLRKLADEELRRRREEEEQDRVEWEQAERQRVRRRQEEKRRQMERLQKMREEEEQRRKVEMERLRLEQRTQEECKRLQEMDASERDKYLMTKEQEEDRRTKEEEHQMRTEEQDLMAVEESRMEAELLSRHMMPLHQQTAFKKAMLLEAEGMKQSQGISRPWVYSYFTLLQLLDLKPTQTYERITE